MPARQRTTSYECQHVRSSGKKCRAIAIRGHRFCYFHLQARRAQHSATPAVTVANEAIALCARWPPPSPCPCSKDRSWLSPSDRPQRSPPRRRS